MVPLPAGVVSTVSAAVAAVPVQCSLCRRWVDRDRLAVVPVGAEAQCGLFVAASQVEWAIRLSTLSLEGEERAIEALLHAYEILSGR